MLKFTHFDDVRHVSQAVDIQSHTSILKSKETLQSFGEK